MAEWHVAVSVSGSWYRPFHCRHFDMPEQEVCTYIDSKMNDVSTLMKACLVHADSLHARVPVSHDLLEYKVAIIHVIISTRAFHKWQVEMWGKKHLKTIEIYWYRFQIFIYLFIFCFNPVSLWLFSPPTCLKHENCICQLHKTKNVKCLISSALEFPHKSASRH